MRHITIHLEDDRFDDMPAEEVPALLFDMIEHRLWSLTDPRAHVSEIIVEVPPEPDVNPAAVNDLVQELMALTEALAPKLPDEPDGAMPA